MGLSRNGLRGASKATVRYATQGTTEGKLSNLDGPQQGLGQNKGVSKP